MNYKPQGHLSFRNRTYCRAGRRIKMFVFLHDVDCEEGHPTRVATRSQNMNYYRCVHWKETLTSHQKAIPPPHDGPDDQPPTPRTEEFAHTRFRDEYIDAHYTVKLGCGKARLLSCMWQAPIVGMLFLILRLWSNAARRRFHLRHAYCA